MNVTIRDIDDEDFYQIESLERLVYDQPLRLQALKQLLGASTRFGLVATAEHLPGLLGYAWVHVRAGVLWFDRITVNPEHRHRHVGTTMVQMFQNRIKHSRMLLRMMVPEMELVRLQFLRSLGFLWDKTIKGDPGKDIYRMTWCAAGTPHQFPGTNRISKFFREQME